MRASQRVHGEAKRSERADSRPRAPAAPAKPAPHPIPLPRRMARAIESAVRMFKSVLGLPRPMIKARRDVIEALRSAVGRARGPSPSSAVVSGELRAFRFPVYDSLEAVLGPLNIELGTSADSDDRRLLVALKVAALLMASGDPAPMEVDADDDDFRRRLYLLQVPEYINEWLSSTKRPGDGTLTDIYRKFEDAGELDSRLDYLRRSLRLYWATEPLMRAAEREEFKEFRGESTGLTYEPEWGYQGRVYAIAICEAFVIARSAERRG